MKSTLTLILLILTNFTLGQSVVFISGLYHRNFDLSPKAQANLLGKEYNPIVFKYQDWKSAVPYIKDNTKVILFSKGCKYALPLYESINNLNILKNIYIVESPSDYGDGIRKLVKLGLPEKNIIVGPDKSRGLGIVKNPTYTPKGLSHWGSLKYVSTIIK
jgi:hypothetical protein